MATVTVRYIGLERRLLIHGPEQFYISPGDLVPLPEEDVAGWGLHTPGDWERVPEGTPPTVESTPTENPAPNFNYDSPPAETHEETI